MPRVTVIHSQQRGVKGDDGLMSAGEVETVAESVVAAPNGVSGAAGQVLGWSGVAPAYIRNRVRSNLTVAPSDAPVEVKDEADYHPDLAGSDSAHLQSAIDQSQANVVSLGAALPIELLPGTHHWDTQVITKSGPLVGRGAPQASVIVKWDGLDTATAMSKSIDQGGTSWGGIVNISFIPGLTHPATWLDLVNGSNVLDAMYRLDEVHFEGGTTQINVGTWINLYWSHLRFDNWLGNAIVAKPGIDQYNSNWHLYDLTADNNTGKGTPGGAFLKLDLTAAASNLGPMVFDHARIELNGDVAAPDCFIEIVNHASFADGPLWAFNHLSYAYGGAFNYQSWINTTSGGNREERVLMFGNELQNATTPLTAGNYPANWKHVLMPAQGTLMVGPTTGIRDVRHNAIIEQSGVGADYVIQSSRTHENTHARYQRDTAGTESWGHGFATPDTNLYRNDVDELKTDDKLLAALGIGVGNSAVATTLGSVTRKMEVFDADGNSLGFVPIYGSIT